MSDPPASADLSAAPSNPSPPSDPYVVYQLRKPSQRGTAVIPRFVPNTHAPAFSPANYRFARVWATSDSGNNLPANALLHVPRSFEYAGSLGSESSFWSDTSSSWVSVSSLRTAPSDLRAPLLHHPAPPVSAAAFFKGDFQPTTHPDNAHFRYPPALSESISEDALVDDLLSLRSPQFPAIRSDSDRSSAQPTNHQRHSRPAADHLAAHPRTHQPPHHRRPDAPRRVPPQTTSRAHILPALTSKRRSLWQWLFCSEAAAGSTTAASLQAPPPPKPGAGLTAVGRDRVPGGDRDFLHRAKAAPDARASRRRAPSFEIRRGRPEQAKGTRRSLSWNLVTRALGGRDGKKKKKPQPPSTQPPSQQPQKESTKARKKKKKHRQKDRARGIVVEEERDPREGHHLRFQRSTSGREQPPHGRREGERERETRKSRRAAEAVVRRERPQDRPREDRPREDRPRQSGQGQLNESAPVQKSVVPSLREKKGGSGSVHSQRMRSVESADPVTSRISSDLSSSIERSTGSGASTPLHREGFSADGHDFDPAAHGVSSDVSSHASGGPGKSSPVEQKAPPEPIREPTGFAAPIDSDAINARREPQGAPFRSEGFVYPSSLTGSGVVDAGGAREWESPTAAYPEYSNPPSKMAVDPTPDLSNLTDPVARALEKNRARSAGGPLSYLMRTHEAENDVDTQSTGLTSLADESVSTHKTVSGVEEYKAVSGYGVSSRYRYRDPKKTARHFQEIPDDISDASGPGRPVIFKNSGLFNPAGAMSPSRVSSSASPRRFHSDWSDPHATDIDVYCQCSCSCVYEEECRRTCELVYGRSSPSVSSSRSCSRRGYPGFQTLPPAMDTEVRYRNISPNVVESSGEPQAFFVARGSGGRTGFEAREKSAQKSYMRASEVDELPDPQSMGVGQTTYHAYVSSQTENHMYDTRPRYEYPQESAVTNPSSRSKRYRTDKHDDDRRRDEPREGRTSRSDQRPRTVQEEPRGSRPRGPHRDSSRSSRRPGSSPRHRPSSRNEGSTIPREQRTRTSSHNTAGSGSSRQSSGLPKMQEVPRNGKKRDFSDEIASERSRRDGEERKRYGQGPHAVGTQQMGNSYVVKRNGPPPFNQAQMPEPYRAGGYGREVSYDYEDEHGNGRGMLATRDWPSGTYDTSAPVGYGPPPVVELEFETGHMGNSPDPHRRRSHKNADERRGHGHSSSTARHDKKGESGNHGARQTSPNGNHHSKGEARPLAKQIKVTSRQSSKSSSRSRTPLFGIF